MKRSSQGLFVVLALAALAGLRATDSVRAEEANPPTSPIATQEEAMAALAWLVGDWRGGGWIQRGPETRVEFTQTEHVEPAFGGRLLLVEGVGKVKLSGGAQGPVVHHAYGVLAWNPEEESYGFDTYLADEPGVDAKALLEDGILTWRFHTERGEVRFRIRQSASGEWHETGEFSADGATWRHFFEMTLDRADEAPESPGGEGAPTAASGSPARLTADSKER